MLGGGGGGGGGGVFLFLQIYSFSFVKDLFLYCNTFLQKRSSRHMYYRLSSFLDFTEICNCTGGKKHHTRRKHYYVQVKTTIDNHKITHIFTSMIL